MILRSKLLWGLGLACLGTVQANAQTADSVKIQAPGNGPFITNSNVQGTTTTTFQLAGNVYPASLNQSLNWVVLTGGTASGSISASGLLTIPAQTSGFIWVKGTSIADPTKADSAQVFVYCKPSHTNPLNWFNIDTVSILNTTLHNGSATIGNPGAYTLFPVTGSSTATLFKGNTYTLRTQITSPAGPFAPDTTMYTYSVSAWIDYNRNGILETAEWMQIEDSAINRFAQYSFTIPTTAINGPMLMRIRCRLQGSINGVADMCTGYTGSGQTEDYIITVADAPTCSGDPGPNPGDMGCVTFLYNGSTVIYPTVRGADGNIWIQKNLGATQVAASSTDIAAYGDVFQWGRWADGHQLRNAATSTTAPTPNNPSGLSNGSNLFYTTSPSWWNVQAMTDRWSASTPAAVTDTNGCDPCKQLGADWHLPTVADWQAAIAFEGITSPALAYSSYLKLSVGGVRNSSGNYDFVGLRGYYWSNEPSSTGGKYLYFSSAIINPTAGGPRAQGAAVRCLRSQRVDSVTALVLNNAVPVITTNAGSLQMTAMVHPATVNQNVTWSIVSGTGTATISSAGLVTAQTNGTVWAKAVSVQNTAKSDSVEITISGQIILIDSVQISTQGNIPPAITTNAGTLQMTGTVYPLNANQAVGWSVIPVNGMATVTGSGLVTAQQNGTVWIKITSAQDITKTDSMLVTISGQPVLIDSVVVSTQGTVSPNINTKNGTLQLEAVVYPATAVQDVTWSIIPITGSATVDAGGKLTAQADGPVWAKAVSVQDTTKADSILVAINGQTTSISGIYSNKSVQVYPNPAKQYITISATGITGSLTIDLIDMKGQILRKWQIDEAQTKAIHSLNLGTLLPGSYILRCAGSGFSNSIQLKIE